MVSFRWMLLCLVASLCVWGSFFGCQEPTRNLCLPGEGGLASHPDWQVYQQLIKRTDGADGCLQMAWFDGTSAVGATSTFVKVRNNGEIQHATDPQTSPFQLTFPPDKNRYAYRFRLFVFSDGEVASHRQTCTQAMQNPAYACDASDASGSCLLGFAWRLPDTVFRGRVVPIDGDESLLCKPILRATVPAEPPVEPVLVDGGVESIPEVPPSDSTPEAKPPEPCVPKQTSEICNNGIDDDCDGTIDQGKECVWVTGLYQNRPADAIRGLTSDTDGNVYIVGSFLAPELRLPDNQRKKRLGTETMFFAKIDKTGKWDWAEVVGGQESNSMVRGESIVIDDQKNLYILGSYMGNVTFGSFTFSNATGVPHLFLVKRKASGEWEWARQGEGRSGCWGGNMVRGTGAASEFVYFTGVCTTPSTFMPGATQAPPAMRLFFGRVSFDNTSGWINSIVQYPFLVPFSAEQFPLITHNGAVFVSSFFDGTTAIGGATFEAAKGKKTMFLTQTTSRGDWRRTNVIGAAKDVVPGGIAVRNLSPGKRVGVVARMAPKQSVWFSAPLSIEVGDKTEGFIAFTEDGVWRRAESIKGALDRWQPTALHYERQTQQWIMGGYLLGSLSLGGGQIVSDPLYGTAFLGVYDYGRASWRRLVSIPGVSDQDTRGLFTHGLRFHQTEQGGSLYMSGGNMNGKIGARDFRRAYSFFVTKNPHLIK